MYVGLYACIYVCYYFVVQSFAVLVSLYDVFFVVYCVYDWGDSDVLAAERSD